MIEVHLQNENASVRADAEQKRATLAHFEQLTSAMAIFDKGHLIHKAFYMFNPTKYAYLEKTLENYKPGIPLTA